MIQRILLALSLFLAPLTSLAPAQDPAKGFDHSHGAWTKVLEKFSKQDDLDYAGLKASRAGLDAYLASLESVTSEAFAKWTREQRYAFWINAYNAYTVQRVVDHYPVKSIKDIGSIFTKVWDQRFIKLTALYPAADGKPLSLNDIEHGILRPEFRDARVHAAVNCASKGCPPLKKTAFTAKDLDSQLDDQVRLWLADPKRNAFDAKAKHASVSKIFDWFAEDFKRDGGSLNEWLARYAPKEHQAWLGAAGVRVSHNDYDWKLNDGSKKSTKKSFGSPR